MRTTLTAIRKHKPCKDGWQKLLAYLGKTKADDEPLAITTILNSNGLSDAIWCLRAVEGYDREIRLFAVWCARQVQHLLKDQGSLDALDVAERYANGEATEAELEDAWYAARGATLSAALAAASAATWSARASTAARSAAAQSASWSASWSAADAARATARAAARASADWDEMRQRQADELRRICEEVE